MSSFHQQLLQYLEKRARKMGSNGILDSESTSRFSEKVRHFLKPTHESQQSLEEIISHFYDLCDQNKQINLEKKLLDSVEFKDLQVPRWAKSKITRGLPRWYDREDPSICRIKDHFCNLFALKKHYIDKAILSYYSQIALPKGTSVALITNEEGCWAAQLVEKILTSEKIQTTLVKIVSSKEAQSKNSIYCSEEGELYAKDECIYTKLRNSVLIIETPFSSKYTYKILEKMRDVKSNLPCPKYELIGDYGCIDSKFYHPGRAKCFGLHFLEKGILIDPNLKNRTIKNKKVARCIEEKGKKRFHVAELEDAASFTVFLSALLQALHDDAKEINLLITEASWCEEYDFSSLSKYGVGQIVTSKGKKILSDTGKKLRLIYQPRLSKKDLQTAIALSDNPIAISTHSSFSTAISANKVYFFDAASNSKALLKDLIALGQNTVCVPDLTQFYNLFFRIHPLPIETFGNSVDEDYFQEIEIPPHEVVGQEMGEFFRDAVLVHALKKLNQIISKFYSANPYLLCLVKKAVAQTDPKIEKLEEQSLNDFLHGKCSFSQLLLNLSVALAS